MKTGLSFRDVKPKQLLRIAGVLLFAISFSTVGDFYHIHTRAIEYTCVKWGSVSPADPLDVQIMRQIKILFPFFLSVFAGMAVMYALASKALAGLVENKLSMSPADFSEGMEPFAFFIVLYFLSGFANTEPYFLLAVFTIIFALRLLTTYDRMFILIVSVIAGIAGAFYEGVIWQVPYRNPDPVLFGTPLWLAVLYMNGVFAFRPFYRYAIYKK